MVSLSPLQVFIHVRFNRVRNPTTREAYFLGASRETTVAQFYQMVRENIADTPSLQEQLGGNKTWSLFYDTQRLSRKDRRELATFCRTSFSSTDLQLVYFPKKN